MGKYKRFHSHALNVRRLLEERYIPEITELTNYDGLPVEPPRPVPWYPEHLAWWMTTPKNIIRRYPPFAKFQKFLVSETSVGNISRQEVVSMIPPLLLDVKPGHVVLDLCAAPGSKAAQLLEMLHQGEEGRILKALQIHAKEDGRDIPEFQGLEDVDMEVDASDDGRATGLLIANDVDYKRSHLLIHQLKRLSSPNMIVTNHDATLFPSLQLPSDTKQPKYLKFDRILADVPCSGDGTLRKNVNLWKDWIPGNALGLHQTQVRILVRALQMLKPGGRVVYSTCSLNPVENESVVAAAIERCGAENIDILDCSNDLPGLERKPGMTNWKVMDKAGRIWNDWDEVEAWTAAESKDGNYPGKLVPTMFARKTDENTADIPLERCIRVYPHQQDTGGFFITALHKKKEFKAKPENWMAQANKPATTTQKEPEPQAEDGAAKAAALVKDEKNGEATPQQKAQPTSDGYGDKAAKKDKRESYEEPFKYLSPENPVIQTAQDFYKISPRFPTDRYMVRNAMGEPAKAVYYTSALVRDVLTANEGRSAKFVHGGVKMFMKQDAPSAEVCRWRIQSEGMPILWGYVGKERLVILRNKETLRRLLIEMFPRVGNGEWEKLNEIGERVRDVGMGCLVLRVEPDGTDVDFTERMSLPLWKSFHSLNLMLPKEDRSAMLLRIYNDTTPLINSISKHQKTDGEEEKKDGDAVAEDAVVAEADATVEAEVVEAGEGDVDGGVVAEAMDEDVAPAQD
ncbi:hypothetical protein VMCG_02555 [Cytospora schulzeri]|uniref:SAM-dependent MTase RsmB/NOP-type domain-containing protein n=1 Tax=Cytospora schulzeri TaxID=448051 RepID=A0A423X1C3_9PEZI|nr:hypothetical protein VMCG_02555 [Valsa malicola]